MEKNNQPHCEYCGCKQIDCLVRCPTTGLYFCNGKGATSQSHIIHHLRSIQSDTISLPPQNKYSSIPFKCYICGSTNIFRLGFIFSESGNIFIACRSPCQFDESLKEKNVKHDIFMPLVSNNEIYPQVVRIPNPEEYQKVPMLKVIEIKSQIKEFLGKQTNSSSLPPSKIKYDSVEDYTDRMIQYVKAEKEESSRQEKSRRFGGITLDWINETDVSFKAQPQLFKLTTLGSSIVFSENEISEIGFVYHRSNNMSISVHFHSKSLFYGHTNGITLNVVMSDVPFKRQLAALQAIQRERPPLHWLILDLFLGCTEKLRHHNKLKKNKARFFQPPNLPKLNEFQRRACEVSLSQRFTLIQGPPGTGKTTVIAALAYSFVQSGIYPILVCAQSNVAADFATSRIAETGVKVTRVLSTSREAVDDKIDSLTTRKKAKEMYGESFIKLLESTNEDDKRKVTNIEHEIIEVSDVVCATCTSSGGARLRNITFPVVIFDESGQCLDPDLLISLTHNAQQTILVGDHCQLGPVILSRDTAKARYDIPLIQRLILLEVHPIILRTQYRMHSSISEFPSSAFYMNLLNNGIKDEQRKWEKEVIKWPNPLYPIMFWNVFGKEENYEFGLSYISRNETICIASILEKMYLNNVKSSDIGIITPYVGQQTYLIETLPYFCKNIKKEFFDELEIASVDAFQGREKNFIIFSCVRANDSFDIGFLKDKRRLCVSLTRAKYGLITLGDAKTFAKNKLWCKYIEHCISKKVFVEGKDVDSLVPSTFTPLVTTNEMEDDDDEMDNVGNDDMIA
ncbi:regulator of nonsense transcripts 1 [Histomonas meleagridis]|uniref:regulator of nonsense transcripts 1 n=1 Tax=Histomonas meleagridis TaxID=135588 RepID=UPI00355A114B|nr:regulator of nonsense transcripts 1 [Histomonas meleagridis]KAH0803184.1 regulator of nonsense transcripts 1 [Histomonas meleagridis]